MRNTDIFSEKLFEELWTLKREKLLEEKGLKIDPVDKLYFAFGKSYFAMEIIYFIDFFRKVIALAQIDNNRQNYFYDFLDLEIYVLDCPDKV
jgi:hypothetical protein